MILLYRGKPAVVSRGPGMGGAQRSAYRLGYIIHDHRTVGIAIVHRRKRLVALLASGIPYFKFDRRLLVKGDSLGEKGGADSRLPIVVKLILDGPWVSRTRS